MPESKPELQLLILNLDVLGEMKTKNSKHTARLI